MKTIIYISNDKSLNVRLEIKRIRPYTYYKGHGKAWPITTQCLLFVNDRFIICGEAIKHAADNDNPKLGIMIACKKALQKVRLKFVRKDLWGQIKQLEY